MASVAACAGKLGMAIFDMQEVKPTFPMASFWLPKVWRKPRGSTHQACMMYAMPSMKDQCGRWARTAACTIQRVSTSLRCLPGGFHKIAVPVVKDLSVHRFRFLLATRLDQDASITAVFGGIAPDASETSSASGNCRTFGRSQ